MSDEYFLADVPDLRPKRSGAGYQRFSGIEILNKMREKRREAKMQEETKQEEVVKTQPKTRNCVQCGCEVVGKFKGRGMCQTCYNSWYNATHKSEPRARKRVVKPIDQAKMQEIVVKVKAVQKKAAIPAPTILIELGEPYFTTKDVADFREFAQEGIRTVGLQAVACMKQGLDEWRKANEACEN